ncbi:MAG: LysR family transcriptional regulator [Actinomycetota bacterium]|jgi:LysR family transcriptional regulator for metE and metH
MRDVTIKQLRSLSATLQAGTIVGAAQLLHVTPPAVSQQLRLLERATGLPLLERTDDGLRATDVGRELVDATARIEAELARCTRVVDSFQSGSGGRVVFGAVSTAKYFAPQILASFWGAHAGVDVQLHIGNRQQTIGELERHDVDLVIMGRPPTTLDLDTAVLGDHPHLVIAAPEHPLANERSISLARLAKQTFLVREVGSGTRLLAEEMFERRRLRFPGGMEISSNETIKQAVIAGLGVALISAHTIAAEVADGRIAVLDVERLPIVRRWYVVRRADHRLLPSARTLWEFLVERGADHLPRIADL